MTIMTPTAPRLRTATTPWIAPTRARQLRSGGSAASTRLWGRLDLLALIYIIAISAGAFGFVDVILFGDDFRKVSESAFAGALWPLAYIAFGILSLRHRDDLFQAVQSSWWILPFPFLVALSFIWSIDPAATASGAIRIGMTTAIGVYIGVRFDLRTIVEAVFWVLLVTVGLSVIAIAGSVDFAFNYEGGPARGLFHHKNTLGSRSALLMVAAVALLLAKVRPLLAGLGLFVGGAALVAAGSAAGLALSTVALAAAPFILLLRGRGLGLAFQLLFIGAVGSAATLTIVGLGINPVTDGLEALGRDATLTGRVILWEAAFHNIGERPLLGTGFGAYWSTGPDWRTLLAFAELGDVLHFHNSFLELAVQLGSLGLMVGAILIAGYVRNAMAALRGAAQPALWPALFGFVVLALSIVEHELFVQHNLFQILVIATAIAAAPRLERLQKLPDGGAKPDIGSLGIRRSAPAGFEPRDRLGVRSRVRWAAPESAPAGRRGRPTIPDASARFPGRT